MKVCTDACLFGAFAAKWIEQYKITGNSILDIGSGTGLLSLMLAQKTEGLIETIELDAPAFEQAKDNIQNSPWADRIKIYHTDVLEFYPEKSYDIIISNPPFFGSDLKSPIQQKNAAKHDTTLTLEQLIISIERLLQPEGIFMILVPLNRVEELIQIANLKGFNCLHQLNVSQTISHSYFRGILIFSRSATAKISEELSIKNELNNYTTPFIHLLKDYYLYL